MIRSFGRLELWLWAALPGGIAFLLSLLLVVSKHSGNVSHVMPALPLIPIFYWGLMHAREMPYWLVFALGLLTDAISGLPIGFSSLLYLAFLAMLHAQRRYILKEGFIIKWGYFAALLAGYAALGWAMLSLYDSQVLPIAPAAIQWLLTVGCYPLLHRAFDMLNDHIATRRWRILHGR